MPYRLLIKPVRITYGCAGCSCHPEIIGKKLFRIRGVVQLYKRTVMAEAQRKRISFFHLYFIFQEKRIRKRLLSHIKELLHIPAATATALFNLHSFYLLLSPTPAQNPCPSAQSSSSCSNLRMMPDSNSDRMHSSRHYSHCS